VEEEIVFGSRKKIFIRREFFFAARQIIEKTTYIHMQIKNTAFVIQASYRTLQFLLWMFALTHVEDLVGTHDGTDESRKTPFVRFVNSRRPKSATILKSRSRVSFSSSSFSIHTLIVIIIRGVLEIKCLFLLINPNKFITWYRSKNL